MYQSITIIGNLGRDPEMKYLQDGKCVTSFSIAISAKKDDPPLWVKVSAWEKLAEICNQYLIKGSKVLVVGVLQYDKGTGGPETFQKQDGTVGASFKVTAKEVRFLSSKADDGGGDVGRSPMSTEDAIPF